MREYNEAQNSAPINNNNIYLGKKTGCQKGYRPIKDGNPITCVGLLWRREHKTNRENNLKLLFTKATLISRLIDTTKYSKSPDAMNSDGL